MRSARGKCASKMPAIEAVRASDSELRFIRRSGLQGSPPKLDGGRHIVRMYQGDPSFAVQCSRLHAAIFVNALIEPIELTVGPGCPNVVGHRLRESAKLRFARPQDFLSDAPLI